MPEQHVDVVKNEWLAGFQHMVARVTLDETGKVAVQTADEAWREIVLRPVGDVDPERDPEAFLHNLAGAIHGTYLFATDVHDDANCPFARDLVVPIHSDHIKH